MLLWLILDSIISGLITGLSALVSVRIMFWAGNVSYTDLLAGIVLMVCITIAIIVCFVNLDEACRARTAADKDDEF